MSLSPLKWPALHEAVRCSAKPQFFGFMGAGFQRLRIRRSAKAAGQPSQRLIAVAERSARGGQQLAELCGHAGSVAPREHLPIDDLVRLPNRGVGKRGVRIRGTPS